MLVIGITGGVGSGKSVVLNILEQEYGAEILEEDRIARDLMEPGGASYQAVAEAFGPGILREDGTIHRPRLGSLVFGDPEKLLLLNRLTHPLVEQETRRRLAACRKPLAAVETALPREANLSAFCDAVWYIHVPEEVRIRRLSESRGYSREKCREIMGNQLPEQEFRALCRVVIENGGSLEETRRQIRRALEQAGFRPEPGA